MYRCYICDTQTSINHLAEVDEATFDRLVEKYSLIRCDGADEQFDADGTVVLCARHAERDAEADEVKYDVLPVFHGDRNADEKINWLPGDLVMLFPTPEHEGPHESDADAPEPEPVEIVKVYRHPNNPTWVERFRVKDPDTGEEWDISRGTVRAYVFPKGHTF